MVLHPGGSHQGAPMGLYLEDSDLGKITYPGCRRKTPNCYQEPTPAPHQLGVSGKGCGLIRAQNR